MSLKGDKFTLLDDLKEKEEESEENNGCQMVNGNTFLVSKECGKGRGFIGGPVLKEWKERRKGVSEWMEGRDTVG